MSYYTAEYIDVDKFEEGLREHREFQKQQLQLTIAKAQAFFEGYEKCELDVSSMLHCSNYESSAKRSAAYHQGAREAMVSICNAIGIPVPDDAKQDSSLPEMSAHFGAYIRKALQERDAQDCVGVKGVKTLGPTTFAGCGKLHPVENPAAAPRSDGNAGDAIGEAGA